MKNILLSLLVFGFFLVIFLVPSSVNAQGCPADCGVTVSDCSRPACQACSFCPISGGSGGGFRIGNMLQTLEIDSLPEFAGGTIGDVITSILTYVFVAAGLLLLVYLVMGGFKLLTSLGDPKQMQGARTMITNALLGFLIVFGAYWIVQIAGDILGLAQIQSIF